MKSVKAKALDVNAYMYVARALEHCRGSLASLLNIPAKVYGLVIVEKMIQA